MSNYRRHCPSCNTRLTVNVTEDDGYTMVDLLLNPVPTLDTLKASIVIDALMMARAGKSIQAIKMIRDNLPSRGLIEAKDFFDFHIKHLV